jgi:hypothetical protein
MSRYLLFLFIYILGRATAQTIGRRLPTTAARVRARVWSCGIFVVRVALGQVFSKYFRFSCESSFQNLSSGARTIGQAVVAVWTQSHPAKNNKNIKIHIFWGCIFVCCAARTDISFSSIFCFTVSRTSAWFIIRFCCPVKEFKWLPGLGGREREREKDRVQ